MSEMKIQIRRKLIAAMLIDRCKTQPGIAFEEALCSQERCIRFATPCLRRIFPPAPAPAGMWKSGDLFLYEFHNDEQSFCVTAVVSDTGLTAMQRKEREMLYKSCSGTGKVLRRWDYPDAAGNPEAIMEAATDFFEVEMPFFERELSAWQMDHNHRPAPFPNVDLEAIPREELPETILLEGGERQIISNQYERNRAARRRCIAAWGTACRVCGFDFGAVYGLEFAGKIEVHHIVPVSEIGDKYVVDPVRDLIPVCSNCHTALHSKPCGVYTPEELRGMLHRNCIAVK